MLSRPRPDQLVQCWYAAKTRNARPLHGKVGTIEVVGKGKPRNHGVRIGNLVYVVPAGNLRPFNPTHE